MFPLVSYPTPSQKTFQDAYENWGVNREKIIIFFKVNIKDDNVFYTDIYTITKKIFTSHESHVKFSSIITPRNLIEFSLLILILLNVIVVSCDGRESHIETL